MNFNKIDEWLDSIELKTIPTMFQEIEVSSLNLTQRTSNMSINKRSPLQIIKNYTTSYYDNTISKSKVILKRTHQPSRLGRFLCTKVQRDDAFYAWINTIIFPSPTLTSSADFSVSDCVGLKKGRNFTTIRLYRNIPRIDAHFINDNCHSISWKDLDKIICRRARHIYDDPYDGNKKANLIKVLNTHNFNLLNGGMASDLLSIFISLMNV